MRTEFMMLLPRIRYDVVHAVNIRRQQHRGLRSVVLFGQGCDHRIAADGGISPQRGPEVTRSHVKGSDRASMWIHPDERRDRVTLLLRAKSITSE